MACCPYTAESLSLGADQPVCSHLDLSFSRCTQACNGEGREVEARLLQEGLHSQHSCSSMPTSKASPSTFCLSIYVSF